MSSHSDSVDNALDCLRSCEVSLDPVFSSQLEDRLMQEQNLERRGRGHLRRGAWAIAAVCGLLVAGAASFAATDGWTEWPWSLNISVDGTVTDQDGNVVGEADLNDDGSINAHIHLNGQDGLLEITPVTPEELRRDRRMRLNAEP